MAFTPDQQSAIDHDGHLLIVAGPGSGKTTTSVEKALRILSMPGRSLVMVTFTKEGAEEMRRRLDAEQIKRGGQPFDESKLLIGTFHSIAIKHLFKDRKREKVLSPQQQGQILNEALSPFNLDKDEMAAVRHEFEFYMYAIDRDNVKVSNITLQVVKRYFERLGATHATDLFAIMRDCALLCDRGEIAPLKYTDLLVDEGQDTDELQKVWIFAHARAGVNVTIVGDDDQSIYEWRHALGYSGMRAFLDTFDAREVKLGDNFRCKSEILSHAVTLVEYNTARLAKNLVARRGDGGVIACYRTATQEMQCSELSKLMAECPESHSNAAVLARTNRSLDVLEIMLRGLGLEYVRIGKSIWSNPHVAGYLSLLQSLVDGSPVGIYASLSNSGLDDAVRTELLHKMQGSAKEFLKGKVHKLDSATPTDIELLKDFSKACAYWRQQLYQTGSVNEVIAGVQEWVCSKQKNQSTKRMVELAADILAKLRGTLSNRLLFISQDKKKAGGAPITLMTMHGSKGLEFETVHIIDANKPSDGNDITQVEPERRLMYVALTRAKNRCFVWFNDDPHPTVTEAQIPRVHKSADLLELAKA